MSVKIVCVRTNDGAAANVGGPVEVEYVTIEVDAPHLEEFLSGAPKDDKYERRWIVGGEMKARREC